MGIHFYYNGTYSLAEYSTSDAVATNAPARLNYYLNGNKCAVATTSTSSSAVICTIGNIQYLGDCSSPTVHFYKNGNTYNCVKSVTSKSLITTIKAGTYTPSELAELIQDVFCITGTTSGTYSRQLKNTVTLKQCGKSMSCNIIYYCADYGKWSARISNENVSATCSASTTSTLTSIFVTTCNGSSYYSKWNSYPVTVVNDIIFV